MKIKSDPRQFVLTGRAGEYAVAAQLLLRSVVPAFPAVDTGIDLLTTPSGCRIQVKAAHLCTTPAIVRKNTEGVYRFSFPQHYFRNTSNRGPVNRVRTPRRQFEEYCDIVVLWGVDQNRFWVVPSNLLNGLQGIDLGPNNERSFSKDVPEMREMVRLGYEQAEIAKHFNISQASVSIRLKRAGCKIYLSSRTLAIRQCEGIWDPIVDFGRVETIVLPPEPVLNSVEISEVKEK
jgi:hypothetical protein